MIQADDVRGKLGQYREDGGEGAETSKRRKEDNPRPSGPRVRGLGRGQQGKQ